MRYSAILAGFVAISSAVPAAAQEDVSRRMFTFFDNTLTVEVIAQAPGTLQIVRGEAGTIDVAARVAGGVSSAALGGREENALRLTALGGDKADFVVVVPEDAVVRVKLPNKKGSEIGSTRPGGTFTWPSAETSTNAGGVTGVSASRSQPPSGPMVAYTAAAAPAMLSVPTLTTVRTIRVRIADGSFEVGGNRPMGVSHANARYVEVQTSNQPEDLVMTVPSSTRDFTLQLGGRTALVVRGQEVLAYCQPVTEQRLEGGVRWFTFSPEAGHLSCK